MKKFLSSLVLLTVLAVVPANAQGLKFGVKGGLNVSSMSLDEKVIKSENRAGWFIGPSAKLSLPIIGFDIAAFYDQKQTEIDGVDIKQQSILIPVNVRGNFGLGSLASIYLAAGPQFGFNVGDDEFSPKTAAFTRLFPIMCILSSFSFSLFFSITVSSQE